VGPGTHGGVQARTGAEAEGDEGQQARGGGPPEGGRVAEPKAKLPEVERRSPRRGGIPPPRAGRPEAVWEEPRRGDPDTGGYRSRLPGPSKAPQGGGDLVGDRTSRTGNPRGGVSG
jgi:hypothetical protein